MSNFNNNNLEELHNHQDAFLQSIKIKQDKEKLRLMELRKKYESGELCEDDISNEDIEKIIELYDEEIQSAIRDTKKIKSQIKSDLDKLKNYKKN